MGMHMQNVCIVSVFPPSGPQQVLTEWLYSQVISFKSSSHFLPERQYASDYFPDVLYKSSAASREILVIPVFRAFRGSHYGRR